MNVQPEVRSIIVEEVVPHAPEVVWKILTTAALIARWLMPNDFEPVIGHKFTFQTTPMGSWDGVVRCEVLELIENERLVYSWKGGSNDNAQYGSALDSVASWTIEPAPGGTRVRLVHSGFRSPQNDFAFNIMSGGWENVLGKISAVAAEQ
ncbi:MAG TPA: SRPBCC domain-containing protein [Methylovirgula sp.]|nr:SRPBCC domain-containing protein [Methylovirgula sp.]